MAQPDLAPSREVQPRRDWRAVYDGLQSRRDSLDTDELAYLGEATWWLGDTPTSMAVAEDVYQRLLADGQAERAADSALRLTLAWATRGDIQVAMAWMTRAERLLRDLPLGRVHGTMEYLAAAYSMDVEGDPAPAEAAAASLRSLAGQLEDPTLACFALVLDGLALVRRGRSAEGFARLDEAMLPVLAGRIDAMWAGDVYCTTIHLCEGLADIARMRDWTEALARWSSPLSETFMYVNVTRVHELQVISAEGDWDVVEAEIGRHAEDLVGAHGWLSGTAFYELGEVRRLRGDEQGARTAYDRARSFGIDPQPGQALLQHAAGHTGEGLAELRVSLSECGRLERARLLLPAVELALLTGDARTAAVLADELGETAAFYATPGLVARASQATALMALHEGRPADALPALERAAAIYRDQRYRHAVAQVHEQLGRALRDLGRNAQADAEDATAIAIYQRLGAKPDLDRLAPRTLPGGLTEREVEVLRCVASGASNREVAARLVISEKTVSRHLANIFGKAGVSTRTAAAAWAREQGL